MLEKEKFPQDYFPEVGAGPGRQAAAERPEQALRPGGVASPWLFPGTGALVAPHTGCARPARLWGGGRTVSSAASCPGCPGGLWPASRRGGRRAQPGSGSAGSPALASGCGGRGAGRRVPGSWRSEDVAFPWLSLSASLRIGHVIWTPGRVSNVRTSTRGVSWPFVIHVGPQGWPPRPVLSAEPQPHGRGVFPPAAPWLAELEPRAAAPRGHVPRGLPAVPESRSATGRLAPWSLLLSRRPPGLRAGARQGHNFISWLYDPSRSEGAVAPGRMGTSVTPGCGFPSIVPDRGPDVRGPASRPGCPWLSSGAWRGRCPESSGSSSSHPARAQPCLNAGGPPGDGVWRPVLRRQGLSSRCQSPVMAEHRPLPTQVHPGSPASHGAGTQGQQWRAGRLHRDSKPPACGGRGPPRLHPSAHP